MSVSWRRAARTAALVAAAIGALALLPSLLRTPEPPPLDPNVGLRVADVGGVRGPPVQASGGRQADPAGKGKEGAGVRKAPRHEERGRSPEPARDAPRERPRDGGRPGHPDPPPAAPAAPADPQAAAPAAAAPSPAPAPAAPAPTPPPPPPPAPTPPPEPSPPPHPTHPPGTKEFGP